MVKLRIREGKSLAQGHTVSHQQRENLNLGLLDCEGSSFPCPALYLSPPPSFRTHAFQTGAIDYQPSLATELALPSWSLIGSENPIGSSIQEEAVRAAMKKDQALGSKELDEMTSRPSLCCK